MYEFETPQPITVAVRVRSGQAIITAEERDTATVEIEPTGRAGQSVEAAEQYYVELTGDTLVVEPPGSAGWSLWRRGGSVRVHVRVPLDSTLRLTTASAECQVLGSWREAVISTASGDIRVEDVTGDLHTNSASGDISVDEVGGALNAKSASGDVWVGLVGGDASIQTASGDIRADDLGGSVNARSASGDVTLGRLRQGEARVQTASGDARLSVLPGTGVYLDVSTVSGDTSSDLAVGDAPPEGTAAALAIYTRTISGDVMIVRAPMKASAA